MRPQPGRAAPALAFPLVRGAPWRLEAAIAAHEWVLVEVYRGRHCGVCAAHLAELAAERQALSALGCALVFVSMNPRALAEDAVREWGLGEVDVGYDLDEASARRWGLYLSSAIRDSEPERFAEPATFLVRGDGALYAADVRSSPHLRPQVERVVTMVRRATEGYPPRGVVE